MLCTDELGGILMHKVRDNSGGTATMNRSYTTWYEFKKDLEKRSGYVLVNWRWLEVKPRAPLPWDDSHLETAISALARLEGTK